MNLQELNLVELGAQEAQNVDGGFHPWLIAVGVYLAWETAGNPVASWNALSSGFNDHK